MSLLLLILETPALRLIPRAPAPSACAAPLSAADGLAAASAAVAAAEARESAAFAALKAAEASADDNAPLLSELESAQAAVAASRIDEQRRNCEASLADATDGAAAVEALDALQGAGCSADAACYRAALRSCGSADGAAAVALRGAGRLVEQAEWAQLILDEMEACGGGADAEAFVLAARSCALAAEYDAAAEVLRRASEAGEPPPLDELEWLVAASSSAAAAETTAAEAKTAYDKLLGELVVSHYWPSPAGYYLGVTFELCVPATTSAFVAPLVEAALQTLVDAQLDAGPARNAVPPYERMVVRQRAPGRRDDSGAAAFWTADGLLVPVPPGDDAARIAAGTARLAAAVEAAAAARGLECGELETTDLVPAAAVAAVGINRDKIEEWVLAQSVAAWQVSDADAQRESDAKAAAEDEATKARRAKQEAVEAAALARREKRQVAWAARNERLLEEVERQRRNARGSMAAAIDGMVERLAEAEGEAGAPPPPPPPPRQPEEQAPPLEAEEVAATLLEAQIDVTADIVERLSALSYRELQAECKARGLPASGKTEVLRQRLEEAEF